MYIDEHELNVTGGRGGDGASSFRREKYVTKGGPDGGDGGRGGNVVFVASHHLNGLGHLRFTREIKADAGIKGGGSNCHGANGVDTIIEVPVGTLIYSLQDPAEKPAQEPVDTQPEMLTGDDLDDSDNPEDPENEDSPVKAPAEAYSAAGAQGEEATKEDVAYDAHLLVDLAAEGQKFIAAYGGRGGFGNKHFATPTHQRPREFNPGTPGQVRRLRLEVKLIADVGLVGLPNAGKSTLLSRCSKARPKVAAYPFTTLSPYLGVVQLGDREQFVMADIPGLIEGASQGKGLGHKFLRHVERTRLLLHLIDVSEGDAETLKHDHDVIVGELAAFSPELAKKPRLIVANKADIPGAEDRARELEELLGAKIFLISGVSGQGIKELLWAAWQGLTKDATKQDSTHS